MESLLKLIIDNYLGPQYWRLISLLLQQPRSLQDLLALSQIPYQDLVSQLKYLLKANILALSKGFSDLLMYRVSLKHILLYLRFPRYLRYVEVYLGVDASRVLQLFVKTSTTTLKEAKMHFHDEQAFHRGVDALIKANLLGEDCAAYDLGVSMLNEEEKNKTDSMNTKANNSKQGADEPAPELITYRGKKMAPKKVEAERPLRKNSKIEDPTPAATLAADEGLHYAIAVSELNRQYKDTLLARRVIAKYEIQQTEKHVVKILQEKKYPEPLDSYNVKKDLNNDPKKALLTTLRMQLLEEHLAEKYGQNGLLVFNTLRQIPFISEKRLEEETLLNLKDLRKAMNCMIKDNLIEVVEVRVAKELTIFLSANVECAQKSLMQFIIKVVQRLLARLLEQERQLQNPFKKGSRLQNSGDLLVKIDSSLRRMDELLVILQD